MNKKWESEISFGVQDYRESSIRGGGDYTYEGYSEKHILFSAGMTTNLTEKTILNLNYDLDYISENMDGEDGSSAPNVTEHYFTVGLEHNFNNIYYANFSNTLYIEDFVSTTETRGEWDYELAFGANYDLGNWYNLNIELLNWAEINIFVEGEEQVDRVNGENSYEDQAEISLIPKIEKTFTINYVEINGYVGAGYVYGYEPRHNKKEYAGFEGVAGLELSYAF